METHDPNRRDLLKQLSIAGAAVLAGAEAARAQPAPAAAPPTHLRKVALEEHFMIPEFHDYVMDDRQNVTPALLARAIPLLSDFGEQRLSVMDAGGIDYVVLSMTQPGVQIEPDTAKATRLAKLCNDRLAKEVQARPTRYGGFAHLALQDPKGAADELERCVHDLGFKGALVNGETNGVYLDDRRYDVFWERLSDLQVPIYIHPGNPPDRAHMYADHPELWGATYSWMVETAAHALRLVFSGTFDRYPRAHVILGHMGETLPIQLWRLDSRYPISNHNFSIKKKPSDYVRENISITTSGVCADAALRCSIDALGLDNVMFSIDYPFESTKVASDWISNAALSDTERQAVCSGNATRILKL